MGKERRMFLYTGNWNHITGSAGLGLFDFDPDTGEVRFEKMLDNTLSCGNMCLDSDGGVLYMTNEVESLPGRIGGGGSILAYRIDPADGELTLVNEAPTLCPNPSYISIDTQGKYLIVSNHSGMGAVTRVVNDKDSGFAVDVVYDDATVDLFSRNGDGSIGELIDVVKHHGTGPGPKQFHPHPHCVVPSPLWDVYAVCDKGNDRIYFYTIDRGKGRLVPAADTPYNEVPGSSPRYGVFHPKNPHFFCNFEGIPEVHSFEYAQDGSLKALSFVKVLTAGLLEKRGVRYEQQDLKISADGSRIYILIHGGDLNAVAVLSVASDGSMDLIQLFQLGGIWPRGCALSPDGKYLLVGCMVSGTIEVCAVEDDGTLSYVSSCKYMSGLSCLMMAERTA